MLRGRIKVEATLSVRGEVAREFVGQLKSIRTLRPAQAAPADRGLGASPWSSRSTDANWNRNDFRDSRIGVTRPLLTQSRTVEGETFRCSANSCVVSNVPSIDSSKKFFV